MSLKLVQIYYNEATKQMLHPLCTPFNNEKTTEFFESSVMVNVIKQKWHKGFDYFGVVSPKFREKVSLLHLNSVEDLFDVVSNGKYDVYALNYDNNNHRPMISTGHPFLELCFDLIIDRLKWKINWRKVHCPISIYANHFIAKSDIYEAFIVGVLEPILKIMKNKEDYQLQKLLWTNSGYATWDTNHERRNHFIKNFGVPYFPHHAFICERLINYFLFMIAGKKFKILCLK